jgi:RNA polymerase sigma factor (TIGR02999 family)
VNTEGRLRGVASCFYPVDRQTLNNEKMATPSPPDITGLLDDWGRGDPRALDRLVPLVYAELRRVAARQLRHERDGHSLQPTALVHEAYLRLVDQRQVHWQSRAHFFAVSAQVMRRILVDHARRRKAAKRGDDAERVSIAQDIAAPACDAISVLALDRALERLETTDPALARIVELRAFGGLTVDEVAHVLKVSPSTAKRSWRTARAWLVRELGTEAGS